MHAIIYIDEILIWRSLPNRQIKNLAKVSHYVVYCDTMPLEIKLVHLYTPIIITSNNKYIIYNYILWVHLGGKDYEHA